MLRVDLQCAIASVTEALASKDHVPVLACVCFTESDEVYAFDDSIALVYPIKTGIKAGGVRGVPLDAWLRSVTAKELSIVDGDSVTFKAGRSRIELGKVGSDKFVFSKPKISSKGAKYEEDLSFSVTPEFVESLSVAMLAMGTDPGHPWRVGVTMRLEEDRVTFFSSDDAVVVKSTCQLKAPKALCGRAVVLPPRFVSAFLARAKGRTTLAVGESAICAVFEKGLRLYSALFGSEDPKQFEQLFAGVSEVRKEACPLPKNFWGMLDHSQIPLKNSAQDPLARIRVEGEGKLTVFTDSKIGSGRDTGDLGVSKSKKPHPTGEGSFCPEFVARFKSMVTDVRLEFGSRMIFFGKGREILVCFGA